MNINEYHEVMNGEETYKAIALRLKEHHSVFIGWVDEHATHFDILFSYGADASLGQVLNGVFVADHFLSGSFQGGVRPTDLFVSIMRVGAFGFDVENTDTDWGYYDEKLGGRFKLGETTATKIAELINGVKKALLELRGGEKE